jgi:hypothetical protein
MYKHEVNPGATVLHQQRQRIEMASFDVIQGHFPSEKAKGEIQRLGGEPDQERSEVHRVEKEQTEKAQENDRNHVKTTSRHARDQQQEEEERERQEERFCPVRSDSLVVQEIVIHDYHLVL